MTNPSPASSTEPYFDADEAIRRLDFFPRHLRLSSNNKPFVLLDWESKVISELFGWRMWDVERGVDARQYREAYIEVPGKQGKTEMVAGMALSVFYQDGHTNGDIHSFAENRKQAGFLFDVGRHFAKGDPELEKRTKFYRDALENKRNGNVWRVWPGDEGGFDGIKGIAATVDEVHRIKSDGMIDIVRKALAPFPSGLLIAISTAGDERSTLAREMHDYGEQVAAGTIADKRFYYLRYGMDEGDDPGDEQVWAKVNPSLGTTKTLEWLRSEWSKAQVSPARRAGFKRFHLNCWGVSEDTLVDPDAWAACPSDAEESAFAGRTCYAGMDLSSTTDITSVCYLTTRDDGGVTAMWRHWMPAESAERRSREDRVPYLEWARDGWITLTPGNVVDYGFIRADLNAMRANVEIAEVGFDPWNAVEFSQVLADDDGFVMVPVRQGFMSLSEPTKRLLSLVADRSIDHGGNPVLKWMVGNAVGKEDENANIRPVKKRSKGRIDGVMALVMALYTLGRHVREDVCEPSIRYI